MSCAAARPSFTLTMRTLWRSPPWVPDLTGAPLVVTRRVTFPLQQRLLWQRAERIIAISQAVRDALLAEGLPPERVVVVPSAVDLDGLSAAPNGNVRQDLKLPPKGQVAVNLGALTPEKDHFTLLEAAARLVRDLPDLHWIVVGDGPLKAGLAARILEHGLASRFHLVGNLPDPEQALRGADLYVLSSTSEGLGSSVLAAMALGVPVVATRVGGLPDLLGSGQGIMVEPRNPAALADAIRRVLTDATLRQELSGAGRARSGETILSSPWQSGWCRFIVRAPILMTDHDLRLYTELQ